MSASPPPSRGELFEHAATSGLRARLGLTERSDVDLVVLTLPVAQLAAIDALMLADVPQRRRFTALVLRRQHTATHVLWGVVPTAWLVLRARGGPSCALAIEDCRPLQVPDAGWNGADHADAAPLFQGSAEEARRLLNHRLSMDALTPHPVDDEASFHLAASAVLAYAHDAVAVRAWFTRERWLWRTRLCWLLDAPVATVLETYAQRRAALAQHLARARPLAQYSAAVRLELRAFHLALHPAPAPSPPPPPPPSREALRAAAPACMARLMVNKQASAKERGWLTRFVVRATGSSDIEDMLPWGAAWPEEVRAAGLNASEHGDGCRQLQQQGGCPFMTPAGGESGARVACKRQQLRTMGLPPAPLPRQWYINFPSVYTQQIIRP